MIRLLFKDKIYIVSEVSREGNCIHFTTLDNSHYIILFSFIAEAIYCMGSIYKNGYAAIRPYNFLRKEDVE